MAWIIKFIGNCVVTKIGLVGFGRWGKLIFRDLLSLGVTVHVVDPSVDSRLLALGLGASKAYADIDELPELDGFIVAVPTVSHFEVVKQLTSRHRPIFVEKPMTNSPEQARILCNLAPDKIFVMDKWRYHPGIEAIAELTRSGALGDILSIRSYRLGWGNPHEDVDAIWILLPHDLSIVLEILGYLPEAKSAFSQPSVTTGTNLVGVLQNNSESSMAVLEVSSLQPVSKRSVIVNGTKGTAQLADSYDDRILINKADSSGMANAEEKYVSNEMPLLRELRAFISHVQGSAPPRSSAAEALTIVERIASLRKLAGVPD
jgi:predicted dehydrogenase